MCRQRERQKNNTAWLLCSVKNWEGTHWLSYTQLGWYSCVLLVLQRAEVVGIGVNIEKHMVCQRDNRIQSFLSIRKVYGHLCKHLGIDSSTNPDDRYLVGT